ncbi:hypothetical protein Sphch_2002 [Sphingobium chlorophenolicum L-1]|uniref:Uncharacterized protein n=1 Tax=Sphingobium chlorophenolicum L-1 TaxID=690566 RepID=F6EVB8_SPHCR|nr:hypothetical protein [Sphingobium chlorophenolicum]AEG49679.1 hypothetical protein Sphch_2002 [Sphingobium chlorophenolicum L-1]
MEGVAGSGGLPCLDNVFEFVEDQAVPSSVHLPPALHGKPLKAGRGTFVDEHIDMRDPEGERLTERLVELYDKVEPRQRKRGRDALRLRLRRLAANALRGCFYRDPASVLYFRKADTRHYADKPGWMRHGALADIVDAMAKAGLVEALTGRRMPWYSKTRSTASSYRATADLIALAMDCGVTEQSIECRLPADELVRLYGPKGSTEFDWQKGGIVHPAKGKRIRFMPNDETERWKAALEEINAFYQQQRIGLSLSADELTGWLAGTDYRLPELFKTDLYRIFNNGKEADPRFDQGGRLFGGWWMYVPSRLRRAVTINDKPTVEIDYRGCFPRMLYHEQGIDCADDPYDLPEMQAYERETGVAPGTYRPCVKWLMQILLNGKGRPGAVPRPTDILYPPDLSIDRMAGMIVAHHQPIEDAFGKGDGLRLMRTEADIALEIVGTATAEGWTALPVHDAFITTDDQRDRLRAAMIGAYVARLGREPVLKEG